MKISQRYPQIMDFYEKRQNNEYFLTSWFWERGMKKFEQSLVFGRKTKTYKKLDSPLKGLGCVSICNLMFAKAQWGIL